MGIAVNIAIFTFYYLSSSYFWFSYAHDINRQAFIWTFLYFILECFSLLLYFCDKKSTGEDDISELSSFEGDSKRKEEERYKRFLGEGVIFTDNSFEEFASDPVRFIKTIKI